MLRAITSEFKLPVKYELVGSQAHVPGVETYFEWPSDDMFRKLPQDMRLEQVRFDFYYGF